jgi:hypothetical protein
MTASRTSQHFKRAPLTPAPTIRLAILHDLPTIDGEPRAGLMLPLPPNPTARRQALRVFSSIGAALAEKARLEGDTNALP